MTNQNKEHAIGWMPIPENLRDKKHVGPITEVPLVVDYDEKAPIAWIRLQKDPKKPEIFNMYCEENVSIDCEVGLGLMIGEKHYKITCLSIRRKDMSEIHFI